MTHDSEDPFSVKERENRAGGSLVAEHLLLRRLRERQIAKVPADNGVHVRVCSRLLHRHRTFTSFSPLWTVALRPAAEITSPIGAKREP
jgi:hypothetical protein